MKPNPAHRLPAPLEAAVQRLKLAAREAAERTIESLGLAALASSNAFHRDGLLGAQFELNRKSAVFALTFNDAFDERLIRELGSAATTAEAARTASPTPTAAAAASPTNWAALSLVEDKEVEAQISADRFGMDIAHACEWELRELDGYVGNLLGDAGIRRRSNDNKPGASGGDGDSARNSHRERNPLRPELVGHAMMRGIDAASERPEIRKLLSTELSRSLAALLPATYAAIVAEMRNAGVQPMGLTVRNRPPRHSSSGLDGDDAGDSGSSGSGRNSTSNDSSLHAMADSRRPGRGFGGSRSGPQTGSSTRRGFDPVPRGYGGGGGGSGVHDQRDDGALGHVDPRLMRLIRRLAHGAGSAGNVGTPGNPGNGSTGGWSGFDDGDVNGDSANSQLRSGFRSGRAGQPLPVAPPPNLIRAHRDALRQASSGALDHMVIDVIGFLFDQILADPKVPPQMARQMARLQLPVLRAALGDPAFFSSRKHPVRRFVNRIASLGAAFEDFSDDDGKAFLAKIHALVQEVVEGDFEQIALYEQKLAALETFTAELSARAWQQGPAADAAALLSEKEDQQRLCQLYAQRLAGELKDVDAPLFLREFLSNIWSQVLLRAAEHSGADSGTNDTRTQRLRNTGRELYLSVQPKATPSHRKAFLAELPRLMKELSEGMDLIQWPEAQRRAFFGQLMPAHADALKSVGGRTLDINLMARQVEGALQRPLPSRDDLRHANLPVLTDEVSAELLAPLFNADEARRVGLVQESAVDWDGSIDIDLSSPAGAAQAADAAEAAEIRATGHAPALPGLPGLTTTTEPAEPTQGLELAQHVQVGFAYRMHLDGDWHKVRLSHVSAARGFFLFTHGGRHRKTVSLTRRMLERLCETGRLKAFESAYLIERATARARRELTAVS